MHGLVKSFSFKLANERLCSPSLIYPHLVVYVSGAVILLDGLIDVSVTGQPGDQTGLALTGLRRSADGSRRHGDTG